MAPHALLLAEASGGFLNGILNIRDTFGINLPGVLGQIVCFGVFALILWKFAFKPVIATLDERNHKIESGLKHAEEMKVRLEAAQQACDAQIKEAQAKARDLLAEAQKAAKEFSEKQNKETADRVQVALNKAREAIELEKKKMLAEARTEVARLVVATTQQVLAKELSELERGRFNEAAARELARTA